MKLATLLSIAALIAGHYDPAATLVGLLAGLLLGLHVGGRHAIRRTGWSMVKGGARRIKTGQMS